jgi:hypothetical protein
LLILKEKLEAFALEPGSKYWPRAARGELFRQEAEVKRFAAAAVVW